MRRKARADANQPEITLALRQVGASVQPIHTLGRGAPDLLVGFRGKNYALEVKDGSRPPSEQGLTQDERQWHLTWKGQVTVVSSVLEALRAIGAVAP